MNKMSSGKTTKMDERKSKKPNMKGKTSEGNIGMNRSKSVKK